MYTFFHFRSFRFPGFSIFHSAILWIPEDYFTRHLRNCRLMEMQLRYAIVVRYEESAKYLLRVFTK